MGRVSGVIRLNITSLDGLKQAAREVLAAAKQYKSDARIDGVLVQQMAATITPEAVVLSKSGEALYQGRIDDRYADLGKPRASAQSHDLQNALDDITNGRPIKTARTDAVGCFIEPLRH